MHTPVLVAEVLQFLPERRGLKVIDATLNGGGHTMAIIGTHPDARILGIDWDPVLAGSFLKEHPELSDAAKPAPGGDLTKRW